MAYTYIHIVENYFVSPAEAVMFSERFRPKRVAVVLL